MEWLNTILRRCGEVYHSDVAVEIATRQRENVWKRVGHRVMAMQFHEARGYVHARVTKLAHNEVIRVLRLNDKLQPKHHARLMQLTIAEMVKFALADRRTHQILTRRTQRAA